MFILTNKAGTGFITHADQENDNLCFACMFICDKQFPDFDCLVSVEGATDKVNAWKARVDGEEITLTEFEKLQKRVTKEGLKKEITELEADLADKKEKLIALGDV